MCSVKVSEGPPGRRMSLFSLPMKAISVLFIVFSTGHLSFLPCLLTFHPSVLSFSRFMWHVPFTGARYAGTVGKCAASSL